MARKIVHFIHTAARIGAIDWTGLTVSIFHLPIVIVQNCHKFFKRGTPQLVCSLCLGFGRLKQMLDCNWGSFSSRPHLCLCMWNGIQTRTTTPTSWMVSGQMPHAVWVFTPTTTRLMFRRELPPSGNDNHHTLRRTWFTLVWASY